jgi:hypothetical protein
MTIKNSMNEFSINIFELQGVVWLNLLWFRFPNPNHKIRSYKNHKNNITVKSQSVIKKY